MRTLPCRFVQLSGLAFLLAMTIPALAAEVPPVGPPLKVPRLASALVLDGKLDDEAWKQAAVLDTFYETYPADNTEPKAKTIVYLTYDEHNFYVGIHAFDPEPQAIRAPFVERDKVVGTDDNVAVFLDTRNDRRSAVELRVNPRGNQADANYYDSTTNEDFSPDYFYDTAAQITSDGWTAEMRVPLSSLRYPKLAENHWGILVWRNYPRDQRYAFHSSPIPFGSNCWICQSRELTGLTGLPEGGNFVVAPYVTGQQVSEPRNGLGSSLESGDAKFDGGLDVKWTPSASNALDLTINPDFSQVESDVGQIAVNNQFAIFFPEKRPFFLEGQDLFITPIQAIFTRTVAEPDFGLKLSSKEGANAFGMFVARDALNNFVIPSNQASFRQSFDDNVDSGVVRYRRDLGARSFVGMLYTDRESSGGNSARDYHNRVAGLDGFFGLTTSDTLRVQYLRSDTLYPDAVARRFRQPLDSFDDDAFRVQYDHFAKTWKAYVFYEDLGDEFRADSGFMPRVDTKTVEGRYERIVYGGRDRWFTQVSGGGRFNRIEDHQGTLTDRTYELFGTYAGPRQSALDVHAYRNTTFFDGVTYDLDQQLFNFAIIPKGSVRFALSGQFGDDVDFDNSRKARSTIWQPSAQFRLGPHLNITAAYQDWKLRVAGGELFDAELFQSRIIYQFNVRTFVRAIIQYRSTLLNQDLYTFAVPRNDRTLFGQFLFSYKLNPQTVLFAGYTRQEIGEFRTPLTQTDRSFFLKIGYALLY